MHTQLLLHFKSSLSESATVAQGVIKAAVVRQRIRAVAGSFHQPCSSKNVCNEGGAKWSQDVQKPEEQKEKLLLHCHKAAHMHAPVQDTQFKV